MPRLVLKAAPDRDLYIEWSTVVEQAVAIGTREQMAAYLAGNADSADSVEERLRRCDETGTSAMWSPQPPLEGAWDDTGLIVEQTGVLRRSDMAAYADALLADDRQAAFALLQPFEDEESGDG